MHKVNYFTMNPCATCGQNVAKLAGARAAGLDYDFVLVFSATEDTQKAAVQGASLPFFGDGETYANSAQEFLEKLAAKNAEKETSSDGKSAEESSKKSKK